MSSIIASELIAYLCANLPEEDVSPGGGGIDATDIVSMSQLAAPDKVAFTSDTVGDVRTVTITGRDATGVMVSEVVNLNGTTRVVSANIYDRIAKVVLSAGDANKVVTMTRNDVGTYTSLCILGKNIVHARMLFINAISGPSPVTRYAKMFWRNTNPTLTLLSAQMTLTADPQAVTQMGCATSLNDTDSIANRLAAPAGITFVGVNVSQNLPTGLLPSGSQVGVWISQSLAAGNAAFKNTFTTQLVGATI